MAVPKRKTSKSRKGMRYSGKRPQKMLNIYRNIDGEIKLLHNRLKPKRVSNVKSDEAGEKDKNDKI